MIVVADMERERLQREVESVCVVANAALARERELRAERDVLARIIVDLELTRILEAP